MVGLGGAGRLGKICVRGDEAGQMNGLGEAGAHPTWGDPNHAQAAEMASTGPCRQRAEALLA